MADILSPEQQQEFARRRLGLQSEADIGRQRINQDYGLNNQLLQEQNVRGQHNVGDQLASQGLFNSGIRINEQGNVQRQTNEQLGQMDLSRGRGLEDISRNLTTGLGQIDYDQAQAIAEATRQQQQDALQRAMWDATQRQPIAQPIPMPNPVITLPQQNMQQDYSSMLPAGVSPQLAQAILNRLATGGQLPPIEYLGSYGQWGQTLKPYEGSTRLNQPGYSFRY